MVGQSVITCVLGCLALVQKRESPFEAEPQGTGGTWGFSCNFQCAQSRVVLPATLSTVCVSGATLSLCLVVLLQPSYYVLFDQ